jgi:hypothetical protein
MHEPGKGLLFRSNGHLTIEVNVLGLDDIKKLYSPDPFLGPVFAKCSIHKG